MKRVHFAGRRLLKQANRLLRMHPAVREDEEIVEFDVAVLATTPGVDLVMFATDRAVYVYGGDGLGTSDRIPYEEIMAVERDIPGHKGLFHVTFLDGRALAMVVRAPTRGVEELVQQKVNAQVVFERHLSRDSGTGAPFRYRRCTEDGECRWFVVPDGEEDRDHPDNVAWRANAIKMFREEMEGPA